VPQESSEAWSPSVGETVRVMRVDTLGRVVQIKTGRYGPEFVIHAFTRAGIANPHNRVVCTLSELAPHETPPLRIDDYQLVAPEVIHPLGAQVPEVEDDHDGVLPGCLDPLDRPES
jgi:hypothetical protein